MAIALGVVFSTTACSPCLGVVECMDLPHRSMTGQIVRSEDGAPVPGVAIELIAAYATVRDTARGNTNAEGIFEVEAPSRDLPLTDLALRISPAGLPGYVVRGLGCPVVRVRGDGCVLNPMLAAPVARTLHFFRFRQGEEVSIPVARLVFTRTGGSQLLGPGAAPSLEARTDESGASMIFPSTVYTSSLDPVEGDLRVDLPPPFGPSTVRGFTLRPSYGLSEISVSVISVGPSLAYAIQFVDSATGEPLPEVEMRFTRTAGTATAQAGSVTVSGSTGLARLAVRALATGSVTGTVAIQTPRGPATTIGGVSFATFDNDSLRVYAKYKVGVRGSLYSIPGGG